MRIGPSGPAGATLLIVGLAIASAHPVFDVGPESPIVMLLGFLIASVGGSVMLHRPWLRARAAVPLAHPTAPDDIAQR